MRGTSRSNHQPCPKCGGVDRFFLVSNPRNGGAPFYLCRQCRHYEAATDADPDRPPVVSLSPEQVDHAHRGYTAVALWCAEYLWSPDPDALAALNHLRQRGLTDDTIRSARLGYHPRTHGYAKTGCAALDWGVGDYLYHRDRESLEGAQLGGLLGPQGRPKGVLRGTITIPYWQGERCVLLRGRPMEGGRYLSPSGVPLYASGVPALYLSDSIASASTVLLCEGEFKALAAHQHGIPAVAQPGVGYLPDSFIQSLAGKTVVVAYDVEQRSDPFQLSPGEQFTLAVVARLSGIEHQQQLERLSKVLEELEKKKVDDDVHEGMLLITQKEAAVRDARRIKMQLDRLTKLRLRVKVVRLPRRADERKVDIDSFLLRNSPDALRQLIASAPEGVDWHAAHSGSEFGYTRNGMHNGKPVANYKGRIVETVYQHDGLITTTLQRLALQSPSGRRLSVDVLDEDWADDRKAVRLVRKGLQEGTFDDNPALALRAIRLLSNQGDAPVSRWVNTCTGWEQIDGRWHFLAPDGAINGEGISTTIRAMIDPDTAGNHYAMCGPGDAGAGAAAWLSFLRGEVCPQPLALLLAGQTALSVLHRFNGNAARSMVWIHHETGSLKTAVVRAGVLALFGPRFTAERADAAPVIKWDSTAVALSLASFYYRDLPLIIDDYKTGMIAPDAFRRYLHAYSEGTSRTRANVHLKLDRALPIRVMVFSTAEDIPQGDPGMQARLLSLVLKPEQVSSDNLAALQRAGAAGHLAAFWRGFIQAIAGQLDSHGASHIQEQMQAIVSADDAELTGHRRTAGSLRQNRAAWLVLSNWLRQSGLISADEARQLNEAHLSARTLLTADLNSRQRESRPSQIFLSVLIELLSNGELTIEHEEMECPRCEKELKRAHDGWYCTNEQCHYHLPAARIVGFRCTDGIGIFANKAFQQVSRVKNDQRQPFAYSAPAIWQQLDADGVLVAKDPKRTPYITRRNPAARGADGKKKAELVLLIKPSALEIEIEPNNSESNHVILRSLRSSPDLAHQEAEEGDDAHVILLRSSGDPEAPEGGESEPRITRITSGSLSCDPQFEAPQCAEPGRGSQDHKESRSSESQRILTARPTINLSLSASDPAVPAASSASVSAPIPPDEHDAAVAEALSRGESSLQRLLREQRTQQTPAAE